MERKSSQTRLIEHDGSSRKVNICGKINDSAILRYVSHSHHDDHVASKPRSSLEDESGVKRKTNFNKEEKLDKTLSQIKITQKVSSIFFYFYFGLFDRDCRTVGPMSIVMLRKNDIAK